MLNKRKCIFIFPAAFLFCKMNISQSSSLLNMILLLGRWLLGRWVGGSVGRWSVGRWVSGRWSVDLIKPIENLSNKEMKKRSNFPLNCTYPYGFTISALIRCYSTIMDVWLSPKTYLCISSRGELGSKVLSCHFVMSQMQLPYFATWDLGLNGLTRIYRL